MSAAGSLATRRCAAPALRVVEAPADPVAWDRFVTNDPAGTLCHLWGWRTVMEEALGHRSRYLVATDDAGVWRGVLPLVQLSSLLFGRYLVSMPFLNAGGPLGTPAARDALAEAAIEEAKRSGTQVLELRSREPLDAGLRRSDRKITVVLPLPPSSEQLWNQLPTKIRTRIRKPWKEGCVARSGHDQLAAFYDVFARHMRDLGTPVLPRGFFEYVAQHFGDRMVIVTVWHGNEPVAGGCNFLWGDRFEMVWGVTLRSAHRIAANMLLYWATLERAVSVRARSVDFGRCSPGSNTHRFKTQWGGTDVPLPWAQWSPDGTGTTPSPDQTQYRLASAVWSRLPLFLTNRMGPWLARRIP